MFERNETHSNRIPFHQSRYIPHSVNQQQQQLLQLTIKHIVNDTVMPHSQQKHIITRLCKSNAKKIILHDVQLHDSFKRKFDFSRGGLTKQNNNNKNLEEEKSRVYRKRSLSF